MPTGISIRRTIDQPSNAGPSSAAGASCRLGGRTFRSAINPAALHAYLTRRPSRASRRLGSHAQRRRSSHTSNRGSAIRIQIKRLKTKDVEISNQRYRGSAGLHPGLFSPPLRARPPKKSAARRLTPGVSAATLIRTKMPTRERLAFRRSSVIEGSGSV